MSERNREGGTTLSRSEKGKGKLGSPFQSQAIRPRHGGQSIELAHASSEQSVAINNHERIKK